MKTFSVLLKVLILVCCCGLTRHGFAALNGAYTINASLPASSTNYQTFQSAVSDMLSGTRADGGAPNGIGVSGPTVFTVAAGTYTGQIEITDTIPGTSASNPVVFDGVNASVCFIEHNSGTVHSRHTIKLGGTHHITFRNFTIRTTGIYGWAIHMDAENTGNITIRKCKVEMLGAGIGSTTPTHIGILLNADTSSLGGTGHYADSLTIDSNEIVNGYYGIALFGNIGADQLNTQIQHNTILNSYNGAIYCRYQNGIRITHNTIKPNRTLYRAGYGINLDNINSMIPRQTIISNNTITGFGGFGLNMADVFATPGFETQVFNNLIGSGSGSGIRIQWAEELDICNNSIQINSGLPGEDGALFSDGGMNISVINNILSVNNTSGVYPLYATDAFAFDAMDYNLFYRTQIQDKILLFLGAGIPYTSFQGAGGFNTHSLLQKPEFVNDTNLRVTNACLKGVPPGFVSHDIDGNLRGATPTIGAHEGLPLRHNLALVSVVAPTSPVMPGLQDVIVRVQNLGDSIIGSFSIQYSHNSATPVVQTWTGSIGPCDTSSVVFTGANQVNATSSNRFTVVSSLPNGVPDPNSSNDTLHAIAYGPLNGNYTIGTGAGADFLSFGDAASVLKEAGVSGPVIFTVQPGTYNEQVSIDEEIAGASSVNTILFDGIDAQTCIVNNDIVSYGSFHTFQIGSGYVRLKNLTIRASSPDYGWGVHINKRNSKNIHVKNCIIDLPYAQHNETFVGIGINAGQSFFVEEDFRIDSIEIDSNIIYNGYAGIVHLNSIFNSDTASEHLFFRNNKLYNQTQYGILSEKANGIVVHGNDIVMSKFMVENATGIMLSESRASDSTHKLHVIGNLVRNVTNSGIDLYTFTGVPFARGLVANNVVVSDGYNGIFVDFASSTDIVNNSVNMARFMSFPVSAALRVSGSNDMQVLNNQLAVNKKGSSSAAFSCDDPLALTACDYNNLYKPDNDNLMFLGSWFSKATFAGASGVNIHSISVNPEFTNDTTLMISSGCMDGVSFAAVSTDRNNNPRNVVPDIGAYEVSLVTNDLAVSQILLPSYPVDSGWQDLEVLIVNRGTNNITSGNISYSLNGSPKVTQTLSTTLSPCDTIRVIFSGTQQIHLAWNQPNLLKVFTDSPNGLADNNTQNDTLSTNPLTPMIGTYTIGSLGNYSTFAAACSDLGTRGVAGPVVFSVQTGTYYEQLILPIVEGASATNTITFISSATHMDSVKVQITPTGFTDNFVAQISGSFYELKYLNLVSTYGKVIDLVSSASSIVIDHCRIVSPAVASTQNFFYSPIFGSEFFSGKKITITHNVISGGASSIALSGLSATQLSDQNIIANNTLSGAYFSAIFVRNTSNLIIAGNTISGSSTQSGPFAINAQNCDSTFLVTGNKIRMTTGGTGISVQSCDGTADKRILIANNSVIISGSRASYGIRHQASSYTDIYHNSVLLNCTVASFPGYFHYNGTAFRFNMIKNNVLTNIGNGVAMYFYNPAPVLQNAESDYNNLYATGANLIQRGTPNAPVATLAAWRASAAAGLEKNSLSYRPGFTDNTDLTPNGSDSASWSLNGRGTHLDSALIAYDINGVLRPLHPEQGVPDIGAYEFTPTALPPLAKATPTIPAAGTTQAYLFASDTVAKITWQVGFPTPTVAVDIRYYSGEQPPHIQPTDLHTKAYWDINMEPGSYVYDLDLYYTDPLIGNLPNEADMKMTRFESNAWNSLLSGSSVADSANNILSVPSIVNTSMLVAGTDFASPLPVTLLTFNATLTTISDVLLTWKTASEINNKGFDIQRLSGNRWETIGFVKGANTTSQQTAYTFTDIKPFATGSSVLYYRLQQQDFNGESTYSRVVSVTRNTNPAKSTPVVHPNPFRDDCYLSFETTHPTAVTLTVYNINGAVVTQHTLYVAAGQNHVQVPGMDQLNSGVYFIKSEIDGDIHFSKMIKQ